MFFWILWGFDALIALVVLYFFAIGLFLLDGSVSSFNMGLWLLVLVLLAAVLLGSLQLVKHHYPLGAKLLLSALAAPGFLFGLMMLIMMDVKDWK